MAKPIAPSDEALALALALSPTERIRLLERVAATLVDDVPADHAGLTRRAAVARGAWGVGVVGLLYSLDPDSWAGAEEDPVQWVAERRREEERTRGLMWGQGA